MTQREATYQACKGMCAGCGKLQRLRDRHGWHVHHCLKSQWLRRRGVPSKYMRSEIICVVACQRCHFDHEARARVIPLERLLPSVVEAVDALGPWAEDLLRRYHPPLTH